MKGVEFAVSSINGIFRVALRVLNVNSVNVEAFAVRNLSQLVSADRNLIRIIVTHERRFRDFGIQRHCDTPQQYFIDYVTRYEKKKQTKKHANFSSSLHDSVLNSRTCYSYIYLCAIRS